MKYVDFDVYDDDDTLVETLPAILYRNVYSDHPYEIVAQVPDGVASVDFIDDATGDKVATIKVSNGQATLQYQPTRNGDITIRVGSQTISRHNQITFTVEGYKSFSEKQADKLNELTQAYFASFSSFASSALGAPHTYPFDTEAQDNMKSLTSLLVLNPAKSTVQFRTIENGLTVHTRDQFIQVLTDAESFQLQLTKRFEVLETKVKDATTEEELNNITWEVTDGTTTV